MVSEVFELGEHIRAPASLLFRLLSEFEHFPEFCPEVRRVRVIWRSGPCSLSRWEMQAGGTRLVWVQQDLADHSSRRISCRLIFGDGAELEGEWRVRELSECSSLVTGRFSSRPVGVSGQETTIRQECDELRRSLVLLLGAVRRRLEAEG